jgi:hypothetical protein
MTNIATVSDEELQHTREIYADLVAEGRELDPASELDRMHARGIFPFALELIDEVLRLRQKLRGADAFGRSINEALNSGDGSYRP